MIYKGRENFLPFLFSFGGMTVVVDIDLVVGP